MNNQIEALKPLSLDQYENCKQRAIQRIQNRIGDKPTRKQFKHDFAPNVLPIKNRH